MHEVYEAILMNVLCGRSAASVGRRFGAVNNHNIIVTVMIIRDYVVFIELNRF